MITVAEARDIINKHQYQPKTKQIKLIEARGKVLAEDIYADRSFPPFDRVAMDGIAIRFKDWAAGQKIFPIYDTQLAGSPPIQNIPPGHCIEIMTGAMLPSDLNAVIRYEDVEIANGEAGVAISQLQEGQNIHKKASDKPAGAILLRSGTVLGTAEIGLLASVGKGRVGIKSLPKVAVIATGDELVAVEDQPADYQIRMSNVWSISAELSKLGLENMVFHLTDEKASLHNKLKDILKEYEVIILSGGVSKGKADYVPEVLDALGIVKHFHRVKQKPGKPFWFGTGSDNYVFAFPGNPVSSFMCFYNYFHQWLRDSFHLPKPRILAGLETDFHFAGAMTYFLQVYCFWKGNALCASPVAGKGSGDFANLTLANAFMELPSDRTEFQAGEQLPIIPFNIL